MKPMSKKRAPDFYVYYAPLGSEEKKHTWANEETFDRLTFKREVRLCGTAKADALSRKASWKKRERRNRELLEERKPRFLQV